MRDADLCQICSFYQRISQKQAKQTNKIPDTKRADSVAAEVVVAGSRRLLCLRSSDAPTAVIHMTVLTRVHGEVSCYRFPCPITQGLGVFGHALPSTSQPRNAFYLPSKEALCLHVSHFKGPVEGCSNLLCAQHREYVLNF